MHVRWTKTAVILLATVGWSSLCAGQVHAQDSTAASTEAASSSTDNDGGDIIVTAQRRSERLQDVPIAVTAISNETMEKAGVTTTIGLERLTPGLRMDGQGNANHPTIRGVSSSLSLLTDANVATYIDGVFQQNDIGAIYDLPDVSQVEVLKGPQGTLFGRNATGGAILITTLAPDLSEATGKFSASYGRFNETVAKGFLSVPLKSDTVAMSVSGYYGHRDGFYRNISTGKKVGGLENYLFRAKIRAVPAEGVEFELSGWINQRNDEDAFLFTSLNGNNAVRLTNPGTPIASKPYQVSIDQHTFVKSKNKEISLKSKFDIGPGTLSTTVAYTANRARSPFDGDNSPFNTNPNDIYTMSKTYTAEAIYNTDIGTRLKGTFGAFYYHNKAGYDPAIINDGAIVIKTRDYSKAYAFFGDLTFSVTDRLILGAGVRYSNEKRRSKSLIYFGNVPVPPYIPIGTLPDDAVTPRASITYKISDDANIYASYTRGFKSGLFNSVGFQTDPVNPEKLSAYEIGTKISTGRFRLNMAAFRYSYSNMQVSSYNGLLTVIDNGASSRIYGGEIEASVKVSKELRLAAGVSYLHARYRKFLGASAYVPNTAVNTAPGAIPNCSFGVDPPLLTGNIGLECDASGKVIPRSPKFSGNVSFDYSKDTSIGHFDLFGNMYFSSAVYYEVLNRIKQPSYAMVDASIAWTPNFNENVQVSIYGRNLTDKQALSNLILQASYDSVMYTNPRTYGVELRYRF
jgi:iron complex outermembrane receptor protein